MDRISRTIIGITALTGGSLALHTVQIISIPFYFIAPSFIYRRIIDHTQVAFCELLILIHALIAPGKLIVSADKNHWIWPFISHANATKDGYNSNRRLKFRRRSVIIANHLTLEDWIYIWFSTYYLGGAHALKIILKSSPKYIPIFGPGMMFFRFIFLRRNWESDQNTLLQSLATFRSIPEDPLLLLIFPEGTILTDNTRRKSEEFAKRMNMKIPLYSLIPRSKGLKLILDTFRSEKDNFSVESVTLGYSGCSQLQLPSQKYHPLNVYTRGKSPEIVFMKWETISLNSIPEDNERMDMWTRSHFYQKGINLDRFAREGIWSAENKEVCLEIKFYKIPKALLSCVLIGGGFIFYGIHLMSSFPVWVFV